MKLPDINLLIYAVDESSPNHLAARAWLEDALSDTEEVGLTWTVLLGFVRITTNPALLETPLTTAEALDYVDEWLARPQSVVVEPTHRHAELLRSALDALGTAGNLTTDAHLAVLAIEHGAELCSADNDFARFENLRWTNPLVR